jgi:hypothetical protein
MGDDSHDGTDAEDEAEREAARKRGSRFREAMESGDAELVTPLLRRLDEVDARLAHPALRPRVRIARSRTPSRMLAES